MPGAEREATGRLAIGTVLVTTAAAGLTHIADNLRSPSDGAVVMRSAGGIIGFLAANPLAAALSTWGAGLILTLLLVFGVLILTATPVYRIPERLAVARAYFFGPVETDIEAGAEADAATAADETPGRSRRRGRGRQAEGIDGYDGDEAFRQAAAKDEGKRKGLRCQGPSGSDQWRS